MPIVNEPFDFFALFDQYAFDIWNAIIKFLDSIIEFIVDFLPLSPVGSFLSYIESFPYLGYLNWFIPIGTCVEIMKVWLIAVASFYGIVVVLRVLKVIGS